MSNNGSASKTVDDYFGRCPQCGCGFNAYVNIGRSHWFYCEADKIKTLVGSNLFSSWRYETEADWERNYEKLKDYKEI
jgi:hypothetical protein